MLWFGSAGRHHYATQESNVIVVLCRQAFTMGCLLKVLSTEFPDLQILGLSSVRDLQDVDHSCIRLIILDTDDRSIADASLEQELELLRCAFPGTATAIMAQEEDRASIAYAEQRGVRCYLPKSVPLEIAIAALRLTLVGGVYYPTSAPHSVIAAPERAEADYKLLRTSCVPPQAPRRDERLPHPTETVSNLTRREIQVLAALQRGRSNKLIACELGMSENTVKVHVQRIMRKLHASNRTEAVLISQQSLGRNVVPLPQRPEELHGSKSASAASGRA